MTCRYALPALLGLTLLASGCAGGFSRHYQAADDHARPAATLESCNAPRVETVPASVVEKRLAAALADQIRIADTGSFRLDFELSRAPDPDVSLFIRGSRLELEGAVGWVVAFDNVSALIDAQKAQAWNEVARRLAH